MNDLTCLISDSFLKETLIQCIWSNPQKKDAFKKIIAKPILLQNQLFIQFERFKDNKAFHENLSPKEAASLVGSLNEDFKQIQCFTTEKDYQALISKKGKVTLKQSAASKKAPASLTHNRQKKYILDTPSSQDFLKALGLMDEKGNIKASKYDKYKQINRYLEIVEDSLSTFKEDFLRIIDFGCGKSYLTFALYHYLTVLCGKKVEVVGLDLKADVIAFCNQLAKKLGYTQLRFQVGDIGKYTTDQKIDMVVSLHACNTATDAALEKAIGWHAKVILAVPCCHHEAYPQIQQDELDVILKHGILKERIAALVTDGLRAQLLETMGYKVQVMEFIDMTHTPKNILIKAVLKEDVKFNKQHYKAYDTAAKALHLELSLNKMLEKMY